jgi:hypothetical protein
MNLPGFTAEASIYKSINHFQIVSASHGSLTEQTIIPQSEDCYWVQTCTLFLCVCRKVCCSNGICQYTGAWDLWSCY